MADRSLDEHSVLVPHITNDGDLVVLNLDLTTASDLVDTLHAIGEHQAAGAHIPPASPAAEARLGALLRDRDQALGGSGRVCQRSTCRTGAGPESNLEGRSF